MSMAGVMQAVPLDSSLMKAWSAYEASDDFKNSLTWCMAENYAEAGAHQAQEPNKPFTSIQREQFIKGALWAAFMAGFKAVGEPFSTIIIKE